MAFSTRSFSGSGPLPALLSGSGSPDGRSRSHVLIGSRSLPLGLLVRAGAATAAVGALSLIEPRSLTPGRRAWYRVGMAAASGLLSADLGRDGQALVSPTADGVLAAGLTMGLAEVSERLDGRTVDGLRRIGIRHPRLLLAVVGAAGTALAYWAPTWAADDDPDDADADDEPERLELSDEARELIAALLANPSGRGGLPGAPALRSQLAVAERVDPGYPTSDLELAVDAPERLVVPHDQTWPVLGRFRHEGIGFELRLLITDGRLSQLMVALADDTLEDGDLMERAYDMLGEGEVPLPAVEDLELVVESDQPS